MISMNDFKCEPMLLHEAMKNAVARVIKSGVYVLGSEVAEFEKKWAHICGVRFGVGVGNGMDAIEIILRGLNIGPGDEVITTPMTAFATVLAILRSGATPVLADIDSETGLLSIDSVQRCLSVNTRALVLVHLYGQIRNMSDWTEFCDGHGIHLLEDCAQAHLASWNGKIAGSFGEAGAYSFYPTKNLGTLGDGGMLVSNNSDLASRASSIRNYGQSIRYHHPELGMNSRLDEIQAAILIERLNWLNRFTLRRQEIARYYRDHIVNPYIKQLSPPQQDSAHVYHLYVILSAQRELLQEHLKSNDIQSLIHYPIPVHNQPSCVDIKRDRKGLSMSELHAKHCLSLPCHPQMSDEDVLTVINVINDFRS